MAFTGDKLVAMDTGSDAQSASGTTTSTTFTPTLTGGTACGVAFVAPASGKMIFFNNSVCLNSGATYSICAVRVRTGGTIGSGSDVLSANDDNTVFGSGAGPRAGVAVHLAGLTPGSTYNAQQVFRVSGGTGTFERKALIAQPQV